MNTYCYKAQLQTKILFLKKGKMHEYYVCYFFRLLAFPCGILPMQIALQQVKQAGSHFQPVALAEVGFDFC